MKNALVAVFTETPELTKLGKHASSEFALAKNIDDAIGPKAREFDALKADAKVKMAARRDEHIARAKKSLTDARELMRVKGLGSFDAWIKSGTVIGMKGKAISKAQVYNLIEGKTGNENYITGTGRKTSSNASVTGRSTPEAGDFLGEFTATKAGPLPVGERAHVKAQLAAWFGNDDEECAYLLSIYNRPRPRFS